MNKKWFRVLFRRRVLVIFLIVVQMATIIYYIANQSMQSQVLSWILTGMSIIISIHITTKKDKGAYKLSWVLLILIFPIFGGVFYILFNFQTGTKQFSKRLTKIQKESRNKFLISENIIEEACEQAPDHVPQINYLQNFAGFPVYKNTKTKYLSPGEEKFAELIEQLQKAEKYIFLEYFIIQEGTMWNTVLDILKTKVKQGVEVRLLYDDMGCFFLLPTDYPKQLEKMGIQCAIFNTFKPFLTAKQNNRDHRKIASIDGKVAFTGGINLADEYINTFEKHGHWKDASIMVEGEAAWSFTIMFLQMWSFCKKVDINYETYYPWKEEPCFFESDGLVQPYADSPMDTENVGEHVYLQMINNAKKYVYITTPYLIIDDSMVSALSLAAKSGVDIRIITPHRWDKMFVHFTTRSYYRDLIRAGVKIYEYSIGFIHSKTFVSDDTTATVGTTNLDFRSLYLHFECGTWLYKSSAVMDIKEDFINTLELCQEIHEEDCKTNIFVKMLQEVFRLFAPLM